MVYSHFPVRWFPERRSLECDTESNLASICGDIVLVDFYSDCSIRTGQNCQDFVSKDCNFSAVNASDRLWSCSLVFIQYRIVNSSVLITKCGIASSVSLRQRRWQRWCLLTLSSAKSLIYTARTRSFSKNVPPYRHCHRRRHDKPVRHCEHSPARGQHDGWCSYSCRGVMAIRLGLGQEQAEIINALTSGKRFLVNVFLGKRLSGKRFWERLTRKRPFQESVFFGKRLTGKATAQETTVNHPHCLQTASYCHLANDF